MYKLVSLKKILFIVFIAAMGKVLAQSSHQAYFIDGFHGGIWGHFPYQYSSFMAKEMINHPAWKINLEIEPVTWDSIESLDPPGYHFFKTAFADTTADARIEYVNPTYGQSYLFNISGESIIRQFYYGMQTLRAHFAAIRFSTYSSEEPCFTSALPGILQSYGLQYASLKNPNTCWGGYTATHSGALVNWIGPDGSSILTVPRYTSEVLQNGSTWQTIAWKNSPQYINAAVSDGIIHPVGMCLQDAGWTGGPWLGKSAASQYTTWSDYMTHVADRDPKENWQLSQEDIKVSLVWGGQILQRVAAAVRKTENKLINLESALTLEAVFQGKPWPGQALDNAWKNLLLSQHHDTWIVPNNRKYGKNWWDYVHAWTDTALRISDSLLASTLTLPDRKTSKAQYVRVFNGAGRQRKGLITITLPEPLKGKYIEVLDGNHNRIATQQKADTIYFYAKVPPLGYTTYQLSAGKQNSRSGRSLIKRAPDGNYIMENAYIRLELNPGKGGAISSLKLKADNIELLDTTKGMLGELKGYFYEQRKFRSSTEMPAAIEVLENGPLTAKLKIKGHIAGSPFEKTLEISKGSQLIRARLLINWKDKPGIGKFDERGHFKNQNLVKAFYDSRYKLQTLVPVREDCTELYRDAPFDIFKSRQSNTFYDRWDSIKNDVLLHWVDLSQPGGQYGISLLSGATTSYINGPGWPLGLTTQYSGIGLFGADYFAQGPTNLSYAIFPHAGNWKTGAVVGASEDYNKPLLPVLINAPERLSQRKTTASLLEIDAESGWEVSSLQSSNDGSSVILRLWNASGDNQPHSIQFSRPLSKKASIATVQLNGNQISTLAVASDMRSVQTSIPPKGIQTIVIKGITYDPLL